MTATNRAEKSIVTTKGTLQLKILGWLCIFVLSGILTAGLWPFHAPSNDVSWLDNARGIYFGRHHGTVLSLGAFEASSSGDEVSCSLEVWLQPDRTYDTGAILSFYRADSSTQFSLHQFEAHLVLQKGSPYQHVEAEAPGIAYVGEIFDSKRPMLVAIASGSAETKIYVDGVLKQTVPEFRLSPGDCNGQLVLGTSPIVNDTWSGQLRGLAIYTQELTHAQVVAHLRMWVTRGRPDLGQNEHPSALYLFNENSGRIINDRSGAGPNLYIPERYLIVREKFLEPPWQEFHPDRSYWKSVELNIGGFIPLGFVFCAYLTSAGKLSRPALATIILGTAVSVTIEVLQAFLPTRDSGMTDIITNTLGTGLGAALFRWKLILLKKVL
jgi:VanZ like family/Concanavalin A-like lectin/glucanases superfamily